MEMDWSGLSHRKSAFELLGSISSARVQLSTACVVVQSPYYDRIRTAGYSSVRLSRIGSSE